VHDHGVFFLEKRWSNDDVGDAGFIFKTQDKSLVSECATGAYRLLFGLSEHPSSTFFRTRGSLGLFPPPRPFDIGSWPTPGIRKTQTHLEGRLFPFKFSAVRPLSRAPSAEPTAAAERSLALARFLARTRTPSSSIR
jgi:hypothetical protein